MNKSDALELIEALRSGKYIKGTGQLGAVDANGVESNCCLGVFCRIKGLQRVVTSGGVYYDNNYIFPPVGLGGLENSKGFVDSIHGDPITLTMLNDGSVLTHFTGKWTFDEIADLLQLYCLDGELIKEV